MFFELTPAHKKYRFTTLYAFGGNGPFPNGGLIASTSGTFFGTSYQGGASGVGAVFELTPGGSGYAETTVYSFKGGTDGANPAVGLVARKPGAFFGTTAFGGTPSSSCNQGYGCGTVFELTPKGSGFQERVLYRFKGGNDGNSPFASLAFDAHGDQFGTTEYGGGAGFCPDGCGTVFELRRAGKRYRESVLYNFLGTGDYPTNPVIVGASGVLVGSTATGGSLNDGIIFELTPASSGYAESDLHVFQGYPNDGSSPGPLIANDSGALFGAAYFGGSGPCGNELGCGAVFSQAQGANAMSVR